MWDEEETVIKDEYNDTITVIHPSDDGRVTLIAVEANVVTEGKAELILTNVQRKQLRKALKRPKR